MKTVKNNAILKYIVLIVATVIMFLSFRFNLFMPYNTKSNTIQESLVLGAVIAQKNDVGQTQYGLGTYMDHVAFMQDENTVFRYDEEELFLTDENYVEGYAVDGNSIAVCFNDYTGRVTWRGEAVQFENGEQIKIMSTEYDSAHLFIYFEPGSNVSKERCGSLLNIVFIDTEGNQFRKGGIDEYKSQIGINGMILKPILYRYSYEHIWSALRTGAALCSVIVLIALVYLIGKKYGWFMASIWYAVLVFSPWVVNFAKDSYWLESLWFLPMLIGLFFADKYCDLKYRILSYILFAGAFFIKSACGYEYISSVMIGAMIFPIVEYIGVITSRDRDRIKKCTKWIIISIVSIIIGFLAAFLWHAVLRGEGELLLGMKNIWYEDILRSTNSEWNSTYGEAYMATMNASLFKTVGRYFTYPDAILFNISGKYFIALIVASVLSIVVLAIKGKYELRYAIITFLSFLAPMSWFVLAKSHSAMHPFLNYVLWYLGFMQMCVFNCAMLVKYCYIKIKGTRGEG